MIMNASMVDDQPSASTPGDNASHQDQPRPRIVRSEDLLQGSRELWIEHGKEMYRLRLTRTGKLYLTK